MLPAPTVVFLFLSHKKRCRKVCIRSKNDSQRWVNQRLMRVVRDDDELEVDVVLTKQLNESDRL